EFESTWQSVLGQWIVDVTRETQRRVAGVQEQLGSAIVHMAQARMGLEGAWASNQYKLGSLMSAVDRTGTLDDPGMMSDPMRPEGFAASIGLCSMPEITIGYFMAAALLLCSVFFGGLVLSAAAREAKALAEAKRNAGRWTYRMAG